MATFKFLVLPHQRKEDGTYNVKIRITQKGKSKYIKTSHNVSASDIIKKKDNGKEKIKIKNQAVIDLMEEMILGFKKKLTSAGVEAEHWDVDRIVEYLTTEEKNFSLNFISYGRKIADDLEQDGRLGKELSDSHKCACQVYRKRRTRHKPYYSIFYEGV